MLGIMLGSFSTALTVVALINIAAVGGAVLPLGPFGPSIQSPVVEAPIVTPSEVPLEAVSDRMSVVQSAATIAFLLKKDFETTGRYPSALTAASGYVATLSGSFRLPVGAVMAYAASPDHLSYTLTITSAEGSTARYDSVSDAVTSQ